MILPRTTLFHTPSTSPDTQSQPQNQNQTPPSSPESWSLPASYRVAIFLDASILLFIFAIILGLILYIRNRRPTPHQLHRSRQSHKPLSSSIQDDEEETLLESKDAYSDSDLDLDSAARLGGRDKSTSEMSEKKRPGPIRIPMPGTFSPVGILSPSIKTPGTGRKRGHVRWTPSVQGGEVFGILEGEGGGNEGEKGKEKAGEGKDGSIEGKGKQKEKKCKCRGRRHPGCWRFELHFEDGARPVLGQEREEGMGRPSR
ncbi:hypothetical protein DL98DRAFT_14041 [Cadophora sp. DSE1049]|nr:hypothetical protein DL98DRAFT_14041 [Cadophora sp. DSE1049]